ncbi:MAG: hypothetical protein IPH07_19790 [Deltaproteobacteria bacterium]|nr:hypothetical protein [Deltaproteobacteria bacterium]MBK8715948.1 hypothetical protein [Deltaproteobacteria bacterium]
MITTAATVLGLLLTLALPIYPDGITPLIAGFLALCGIAGLFGFADRKARYELAIMAPWGAALVIGVLVGSMHNGESQQAIEDALPYLLFIIGLIGGRGTGRSARRVLQAGLWVCVIDSIVSIALMDSFAAGVRSTFNYYKITAGLPLVGLYLAAVLRDTAPPSRSARSKWVLHAAVAVVMIVGIVLSVTRGMLIGWILGVVVAAYVRKPSQALMGLTVLLVALVVWSSAFAELGNEYLRFGQGSTIEGRFREVEAAWAGFVAAPFFGQGLGAMVDVDGFHKAFVHNLAAYQLWKFGILGTMLLLVPLLALARELGGASRKLRAHALGGAVAVLAYLVTCAAYKTYYLVWILGAVVGASLSFFEHHRAKGNVRAVGRASAANSERLAGQRR